MSCPLECVVSVKQTSKVSTSLPLELQQQIYMYLDTRSYYSARKACKYWAFASTDAVPLARQLRQLPILPPVDAASSNTAQLQHLYDQAAWTLMLGVRSERAHDEPGSLTRASKMGFSINPRITATTNGGKTVTLNGRMMALYDTASEEPVCISQRALNDLKETIGSGPWLKINQQSELALSSDGRLLAIAQERTIQIYDLLAEPDSFTVNQYISSAAGQSICGLAFEQENHVLRVLLHGKGTVLYVGTPPNLDDKPKNASLEHWKSRGGLKHTFLDSSLLTTVSTFGGVDQTVWVSGVQLLQPFEKGYLFAGQSHGGGEASHYILGHVKANVVHNAGAPTVDIEGVTVLARLESFLSSWSFTLESSSERGIGLWENMPAAHEHHPKFAIDLERGFLALVEKDKKRIRLATLCQLFVYRLPTQNELLRTLEMKEAEKNGRWATPDSFLDKLDGKVERSPAQETIYTIPRVPLCLSTIQNDVTDLVFRRVDESTTSISASTAETTRTWLLQEL